MTGAALAVPRGPTRQHPGLRPGDFRGAESQPVEQGRVSAELAASVACALAPSIAVMAIARLVQGFAGGWAMVIGRAVIVDLASGTQLVRALDVVMAVGGVAPIAAPLLGGAILQVSTWRAPFWVLALAGAGMVAAAYLWSPESLPAHRRHSGGLRTFA